MVCHNAVVQTYQRAFSWSLPFLMTCELGVCSQSFKQWALACQQQAVSTQSSHVPFGAWLTVCNFTLVYCLGLYRFPGEKGLPVSSQDIGPCRWTLPPQETNCPNNICQAMSDPSALYCAATTLYSTVIPVPAGLLERGVCPALQRPWALPRSVSLTLPLQAPSAPTTSARVHAAVTPKSQQHLREWMTLIWQE